MKMLTKHLHLNVDMLDWKLSLLRLHAHTGKYTHTYNRHKNTKFDSIFVSGDHFAVYVYCRRGG